MLGISPLKPFISSGVLVPLFLKKFTFFLLNKNIINIIKAPIKIKIKTPLCSLRDISSLETVFDSSLCQAGVGSAMDLLVHSCDNSVPKPFFLHVENDNACSAVCAVLIGGSNVPYVESVWQVRNIYRLCAPITIAKATSHTKH